MLAITIHISDIAEVRFAGLHIAVLVSSDGVVLPSLSRIINAAALGGMEAN
jgi:hypothetical protein